MKRLMVETVANLKRLYFKLYRENPEEIVIGRVPFDRLMHERGVHMTPMAPAGDRATDGMKWHITAEDDGHIAAIGPAGAYAMPVPADDNRLLTAVRWTSMTLIGVCGEYPYAHGNCFSVTALEDGRDYRILNMNWENMDYLVKSKDLKWPLRMMRYTAATAMMFEPRIPREAYSRRICPVCCPTDSLPIMERIERMLMIERGEIVEHAMEVNGREVLWESRKIGGGPVDGAKTADMGAYEKMGMTVAAPEATGLAEFRVVPDPADRTAVVGDALTVAYALAERVPAGSVSGAGAYMRYVGVDGGSTQHPERAMMFATEEAVKAWLTPANRDRMAKWGLHRMPDIVRLKRTKKGWRLVKGGKSI